jgi:hypothetical protein
VLLLLSLTPLLPLNFKILLFDLNCKISIMTGQNYN